MQYSIALTLGVTAALVLALGLVLGVWQYRQYQQRMQISRFLDATLQRRQFAVVQRKARAGIRPGEWLQHKTRKLAAWLDTPAGQQVIAKEDRDLLVQCGFYSRKGSLYLLAARVVCMVVFPLMAWLWSPGFYVRSPVVCALAAMALGYLFPKWLLRRRATQRCKLAEEELPLLLDLFGLLQGSGQGVDQSLHLIARDFQRVLPVLSRELELANRLYASGRTRDQAFSRMSEMFRSSNLADFTALLVQIDKHGGAVQEPLREFGRRLRDQRRMQMKEIIGKATVKMTGVMIVTLLPALMVVTAGPGFIALMRSLGGMK